MPEPITHPTFMYQEAPDHDKISLTWWVGGEQYAKRTRVAQHPTNRSMHYDRLGHQWLLEQFVDWINNRA